MPVVLQGKGEDRDEQGMNRESLKLCRRESGEGGREEHSEWNGEEERRSCVSERAGTRSRTVRGARLVTGKRESMCERDR